MELHELLEQHFDEMVEIRRYLHANPELSYEEVETPKYIAKYHEALGHEVRVGVGGNGVVAKLKGGKEGKTVALRADFDALAITEQTGLPYQSKHKGRMHACGHDGHTATLLVLAKVLNKISADIEGNIIFIHQHAEEIAPGGAISMIEDGCLDGVDAIYGTHLWATEPAGNLMINDSALMAAADGFEITIQGKGGHGSEPQNTKDSILIGAQFVTNVQQVVSRRVNPLKPAVVSIGHFEALNPFNVIADSVFMKGTARMFDVETRNLIEQDIEKVLNATCSFFDATYEYKYTRGYPAVINHKEHVEEIIKEAEKISTVKHIHICDPIMGGEDFAYYLERIPGAFFFTGAKNPIWQETYPHHHPKFDIDETALLNAANILGAVALAFLKK